MVPDAAPHEESLTPDADVLDDPGVPVTEVIIPQGDIPKRPLYRRTFSFIAANWLAFTFLVVLLALAVYVLSPFVLSAEGDQVSSFRVTATDGTVLDPAEYRGEVILLDIMTSRCSVCLAMHPDLIAFEEAYGDVVNVWSISTGFFDTDKIMADYQAEHGGDWPIAVGNLAFTEKFNRERTTPKIMVIDADGIVTYEARGFHNYAMMEEQVVAAGVTKL